MTTEPVHFPDDPFGASKPVTSYTELIACIRAEVEKRGIRSVDFDHLAGFAPGLSGKIFGLLQVRQLRLEYMFAAIRAVGGRLRFEIDPEQQAKMIERIANNYTPRQANQARSGHASTLPSSIVLSRILKPIGRLGGKARWHRKSKKDRSAHMTMMVMAREKKRRKARRAASQRKQRARERLDGSQQAGA